MAVLQDVSNPSFVLLQVNNNRTAWRPFGLPVILVIPHRRSIDGFTRPNSQISNVRIFIEDVPQKSPVAGHDHIGLFFPDRERFAVNVSTAELLDRQISLDNVIFLDENDNEITREDASNNNRLINGNYAQIEFTTASGIKDKLTFLPHADYFDLSDIQIETEELPPDRYNLVYSGDYFFRVTTGSNSHELVCIDVASAAMAIFRFILNHPGEVIEDMVRMTPAIYLTDANKGADTTIELYRPFSDILNDIYDELDLLQSISHVFKVPFEAIPHLSRLLGWDIPYYPQSLDALRRAVLRQTTFLQQIRGSRYAVNELFNLFGFKIFIANLWWSPDGERLMRPNELVVPPDFEDYRVSIEERCQFEIILDDYTTDGFGELTIPLVYRPQILVGDADFTAVQDEGSVTIEAFLVTVDSPAYLALQQLSSDIHDDPKNIGEECTCSGGVFIETPCFDSVTGSSGIIGRSRLLISGVFGKVTSQELSGLPPLIDEGVRFDRALNQLSLTFNGYMKFEEDNAALFVFALYPRQETIVPTEMEDLQSNRFSIQIIDSEGLLVSAEILDFLLNFLFKIKAFHSLLEVVRIEIALGESYEVTDFCAGADIQQRFDTDAGQLQVPPAIIPVFKTDEACSKSDPSILGFKLADLQLRELKLERIQNEFDGYKELDGREVIDIGLTRVESVKPIPSRDDCQFTPFGQDRVPTNPGITQTNRIEFNPGPLANTTTHGKKKNPEISPIEDVDDGIYISTGPVLSTDNNSGLSGTFMVDHDVPRETLCNLDGVTDYCFKGRVVDELLYRQAIIGDERIRCKPCPKGMGSGVYWAFPIPSMRIVAGNDKLCPKSRSPHNFYSGKTKTNNVIGVTNSVQSPSLEYPYDQPLTKEFDNYLSRQLRAYDIPEDASIHFSNRPAPISFDQAQLLALQRPSIDIEIPYMHFPGTRFATMNRLADDLEYTTLRARPWDEPYSDQCGKIEACGERPNFLNANITIGTNGDEVLDYADVPYTLAGNGLEPDIPSLGSHEIDSSHLFTENSVVHAVFSSQLDEGHPAISLEGVCPCGTASEVVEVTEGLFSSAAECTGDIYDYCDGYACESGFQVISEADLDLGRSGLYDEVLDCLGVPDGLPTGSEALFFLISGIYDDIDAFRLDCGCLLVDCIDITGETDATSNDNEQLLCLVNEFVNQRGECDFNCDQIEVFPRIVLDEIIGACSYRLDGSIPSLFETVST